MEGFQALKDSRYLGGRPDTTPSGRDTSLVEVNGYLFSGYLFTFTCDFWDDLAVKNFANVSGEGIRIFHPR